MSEPLLSQRLRQAIQVLAQNSARRAQAEADLKTLYRDQLAKIEAEFKLAEQTSLEKLQSIQDEAIQIFQDKTKEITEQFEKEHSKASREYSAKKLKVTTEYEEVQEELELKRKEAGWATATVLEADKKMAQDEFERTKQEVAQSVQRIQNSYLEANKIAARWDVEDLAQSIHAGAPTSQDYPDPVLGLEEWSQKSEEGTKRLKQMRWPALVKGKQLTFIFVALWLLLQIPAFWMEEWYYWVPTSFIGMVLIELVARYLLKTAMRSRFASLFRFIKQAGVDGEVLRRRAMEEATARHHDRVQQARGKYDQAFNRSEAQFQQKIQERNDRKEHELNQLKEKYEPQLELLQQQRDTGLREAEADYQEAMSNSTQKYDTAISNATNKKNHQRQQSEEAYQKKWEFLTSQWKKTLNNFESVARKVNKECCQCFLPWEDYLEADKPASKEVPRGLRFGTLEFRPDLIPSAISDDDSLCQLVPASQSLPALLNFPEHGSVLLKAGGEARAKGIELLQSLMLRCLTSLPPGKVKFTILDPVGLGEHFAAFTHLADYDDKLVTSRIWTEPSHIEQRLADLTEHIENVIQKYLRNQFDTLEEYNRQAGEVAEPYRVLVIAHFPVNFSEQATRRLVSIANSGARCGIHTFILVDEKQPLPRNFDLAELAGHSTVLEWDEDRFIWKDPCLENFPLELDTPPGAEICTSILKIVGERALAAGRVEVPFQVVALPKDKWWTGDSRDGIQVALGRSGATRNQILDLGKGTSQHVLIAGKTGSGKSTLLHTLIVQLGLQYSPDEVELYLVDFKKGVEFKTYAEWEMPHARVVAVESEREFGLSVLQKLDSELKERGERFRALGVNDVPGFREVDNHPMPRILLVVDEFQEFFVEDDRISQEAALLLDRLVRQGRAFGVHVILGSQTLGGAYSLARSTIDQMAIRIALQCSETDGHLILSKDNPAARLLSRPGEAIYNNANGLLEGNNLFQVVWLAEEQRDECLQELQYLAEQRPSIPLVPRVVFEGNSSADLSKNPLLHHVLQTGSLPFSTKGYPAWLGDAVAIKDPTAAVFKRHSGSNLLVVGQQTEGPLGVMTAAIISLALQSNSEENGNFGARFVLLCDESGDDGADPFFRELAETFPNQIEVISWEELPATITALAEEVDRRLQSRDKRSTATFLCIHGLQQFRGLRKEDDDFGFGRRDENKPPSPARNFSTIFREGPIVGVFTLISCDTLNNVHRFLDRQALREFEMRILFQMNANDSSNLIDSPIAGKLGLHRALLYSEDQGRLEKFRPYGLPERQWLGELKQLLARPSLTGERG